MAPPTGWGVSLDGITSTWWTRRSFPTVPATTFTLTIMANAHRIASEIARDLRMTSTDSARSPDSADQPIVAITGASGYLGSVLVAAFGSAGFSVSTPGADAGLRVPATDPSTSTRRHPPNPSTVSTYSSTVPTTCRSPDGPTSGRRTSSVPPRLLDRPCLPAFGGRSCCPQCRRIRGTRQLYGRAKLDTEAAALSRGYVCRPSGLGLRTWLGRDGRNSAPACRLPVLPDFGSRLTSSPSPRG